MTTHHEDESVDSVDQEREQVSRRRLLRSSVAAGVAIGVAGLGLSRLASADDDHDEDDESGGHGGDDDDRNDDNSGSGHGGGDDDGGHDDLDDDSNHHQSSLANASPVADVTTIEIRDETFIPAHIIIDPGQTVTWDNLDDDEHTATGATFDTGTLDRGESGEIRFDTPGVFPFVCQFHAHMQGSVTVRGEVATPVASPAASPAAVGNTIDVSIIDFAFDPAIIEVEQGTRVIWTNKGQAPHTVTGGFVSSELLQPGDSVEFVFTAAGDFSYICALHAQMSGQITVL